MDRFSIYIVCIATNSKGRCPDVEGKTARGKWTVGSAEEQVHCGRGSGGREEGLGETFFYKILLDLI